MLSTRLQVSVCSSSSCCWLSAPGGATGDADARNTFAACVMKICSTFCTKYLFSLLLKIDVIYNYYWL